MKAQSAVEYLITYGWMLISVTAISGALYGVVDSGECPETVTGLQGDSIQVEDFAVTSEDTIDLVLLNSDTAKVSVNEIRLEKSDSETFNTTEIDIGISQTETTSLPAVENSDSCNSFDLEIQYNVGPLENMEASGTLTTQADIQDLDSPSAPENSETYLLQ